MSRNDVAKYKKLDFTNDFMFCKILVNNPELCKELLEVILGVKIRKLNYLNKQEEIEITSDGKGIRLDVYVEDEKNTVYDIEMQASSSTELPKRSRYYQGMIDLNLIERGAAYGELKRSIIIFICISDPFDRGLYAYHFTNRCREDVSLELQDDTEKVFLNASGSKGEISDDLKTFLDFLKKKRAGNEFTRKLETEVMKARERKKWRLEYMTLLQRDNENFQRGIEQGIVALVKTLTELKHPTEVIIRQLMDNFKLSEDEARAYVMKYEKRIEEHL